MSETSTPTTNSQVALQGGPDALPKRYGKYTLLRQLATGGMAELFLALHRSVAGFEKLVVIKRILPSMNRDQAFIDMLMHEARIAATLSHPNVVQVFDVGHQDGTYYIAMEYIHGEDLRSIVRQMKKRGLRDFPREHALSVCLGVCAALAYAHEKRGLDGAPLGIVHRDISPQNVIITYTGDVKVVDFGIAKSRSNQTAESEVGKLKGKIPYMSPEQARGEDVDWRSDIFAAGILLFELTTGRRLFKGSSELDTLRMICQRDYPRPSQVAPDYPEPLEAIVMRALAKDREQRYQSAREMQADLEAYVRQERVAVSETELTRWMQELFEDRLAQQKEALQDIKHLADIIAAQSQTESLSLNPDSLDLTSHTGQTLFPSVPGGAARTLTQSADLPTRSRWRLVAMAGGAVLAASLGFVLWQQHGAHSEPAPAQAVASESLPQSSTGQAATGALQIHSDPEGASIWINESLRAERTPATISQLPLGATLTVRLTKEGYAAERRELTLSGPQQELRISLQKGTAAVDIKTNAPGARVFLDNKPVEGLHLEGITPNQEHQLVVTANGFAAKTTSFVANPNETKTLTVNLEHDPNGKKTKDEPGAEPAKGGSGKLNVSSRGGYCNVTVGGRSLGSTPVGGIVLPAGTHTVSCRADSGASKAQSVRIEPDQTARISFDLSN